MCWPAGCSARAGSTGIQASVAGTGGGELHRQVLDIEAVELIQDRPVTSLMLRFAARTRARTTTEM